MLFIIALIILVVVFIVKTRRFKKQGSIPHERFHNDIIEHNPDGSVSVSNQLYDLDMQPTSTLNGFAEGGDNLKLSNSGSAYYSKPTMNGNNSSSKHAFANPLYGHNTSDSVLSDRDNLPQQDEVTFPIDDTVSKA